MVVFSLLRWRRQAENKMRLPPVRQNVLCFGIARALPWSSGVLFRALYSMGGVEILEGLAGPVDAEGTGAHHL